MKQNGAAEHLYIRDQIFFWAHLLCELFEQIYRTERLHVDTARK